MDTATTPGLGELATLAFAASIAVYEYFAPPGHLISDVIDRLRARFPWVVYPVVAAFALHLTRLVPPRLDAVRLLGAVRPAGRWPFI